MNRVMATMILLLFLLPLAGSAPAQTVVYSNDFETSVTTGWSTRVDNPRFQGGIATAVAPNGPRFLGVFGQQSVRLDLAALPRHDSIRIVFDLYTIYTWDGNRVGEMGPDVWSMGVAGAPPLVRTTFNNTGSATQAYPDSFPGGVNRFRHGAVANYSLGYSNYGDAIYHFDLSIPHDAATLTLEFFGDLKEEFATALLSNESWGIDNITITAVANPVVLSAATLEVGDVTGAPGDLVELPIRLRDARGISASGVTGFSGTLRFDASLLLPVDGTPMGTVTAGVRQIPLAFPATTGPDSILAKLRFRAALGSATSTLLVLDDLDAVGGAIVLDTSAGRFTLLDVCGIGVSRLVATGALPAIKASPNPSSSSIEIVYTLLEDGPASLALFDAAGVRIAILFDGAAVHGEYQRRLDLSTCPAGSYLLVLRSAGSVITHRILLGQ